MTNQQTEELISIFSSARKIESKYREYFTKIGKNKNERTNEEIRNIFDDGIGRAYVLFEKDIKTSEYLFTNQKEIIEALNNYLNTELIIKDLHKKYITNNHTTIRELISTARNKDIHAKNKSNKNLLILYKIYINDVHFTTIEKFIEKIICSRMDELTEEERIQMIALNPNNEIWLANQKEFAYPFLKYLKENHSDDCKDAIKQLEILMNFDLTVENVKREIDKNNKK